MKRVFLLLLAVLFITCSLAMASTNKPLENLASGLDDIVYGKIEIPDNMNETGTKGTPAYAKTTDKTKDGVGRGIVKCVGGLFKIATFWYPTD